MLVFAGRESRSRCRPDVVCRRHTTSGYPSTRRDLQRRGGGGVGGGPTGRRICLGCLRAPCGMGALHRAALPMARRNEISCAQLGSDVVVATSLRVYARTLDPPSTWMPTYPCRCICASRRAAVPLLSALLWPMPTPRPAVVHRENHDLLPRLRIDG